MQNWTDKWIVAFLALIVFTIPAVAEARDESFVGTWKIMGFHLQPPGGGDGPSVIYFDNDGTGHFRKGLDSYSFSWRSEGTNSLGDPVARLEVFRSGPSGIAREVYRAEIHSYSELHNDLLNQQRFRKVQMPSLRPHMSRYYSNYVRE
jgi:hypothetical protein